jgi:hypothetical protein
MWGMAIGQIQALFHKRLGSVISPELTSANVGAVFNRDLLISIARS